MSYRESVAAALREVLLGHVDIDPETPFELALADAAIAVPGPGRELLTFLRPDDAANRLPIPPSLTEGQ